MREPLGGYWDGVLGRGTGTRCWDGVLVRVGYGFCLNQFSIEDDDMSAG